MSTSSRARPRGAQPGDQQKDKQFSPQTAVVQRGTTSCFPTWTHFHSVFSTVGEEHLRPRELPFGRSGAVGHADHARGRRGVLQHPREDERDHPGRTRRRSSPRSAPTAAYRHGERSRSGHGSSSPGAQDAKPAQQKVDVGSGSRARSNFTLESRARRRTRTNSGSHTGHTRNKLYRHDSAATSRHDVRSQDSSLLCAAAALAAAAGASCAPRQTRGRRRRERWPLARRRACSRRRQKALEGLERGPRDRGQGGGRDPAAEGGAGRRRRRGHDPRPVRQ